LQETKCANCRWCVMYFGYAWCYAELKKVDPEEERRCCQFQSVRY
jgi:hypothetical protein